MPEKDTAITRVLAIEDASKLYSGTALTPTAIRRLVRAGKIPIRKVGAKCLIAGAAIEGWPLGDAAPRREGVLL